MHCTGTGLVIEALRLTPLNHVVLATRVFVASEERPKYSGRTPAKTCDPCSSGEGNAIRRQDTFRVYLAITGIEGRLDRVPSMEKKENGKTRRSYHLFP